MKNERYFNPADIRVPPGYRVEIFAHGLNAPYSMVFNGNNELIIGESGLVSGNPRVLRLTSEGYEVIADGFQVPLTGVNYLNGEIYVSHRGYVTVIKRDGSLKDIISGLPSNGDHSNTQVTFGNDRKIYFGQGTVTNSGVVGLDNEWISDRPFLHDRPGDYIILNGQNFVTPNIMIEGEELTYTGAFAPFGVPNRPYEVKRGYIKASGSILRANMDGSELELVSWGLRNPCQVKFDLNNNMFVSNRSYDVRGSRPIANAPDEFYLIEPGLWYGWPDYSAGEPVSLPKFKPEGGHQPEILLNNQPGITPVPYAKFAPHSTIMGFDFNYSKEFGPVGDVYIAEYGSLGFTRTGTRPYAGIGHRVSKIDMNTGQVSTFAINKSGLPATISREGGFGRPSDIVFGPDKAMYILDFAISSLRDPNEYQPNTGGIWKITKMKERELE